MAVISTPSADTTASRAAPVPRPPQPTSPTRMVSELEAYAKLPEAISPSESPAVAAVVVFKNVRRDGSAGVRCVFMGPPLV